MRWNSKICIIAPTLCKNKVPIIKKIKKVKLIKLLFYSNFNVSLLYACSDLRLMQCKPDSLTVGMAKLFTVLTI